MKESEKAQKCEERILTKRSIIPNKFSWLAVALVWWAAFGTAAAVQNSVMVWGNSSVTNVPADATNIASVAAGGSGCVAVGRDGQLHAWGYTGGSLPSAATNAAAVAMVSRPVILRRDGSVVYYGAVVAGVSNSVAVAAAQSYGAGVLRSDGVFTSWDGLWQPTSGSNVVAIAGNAYAAVDLLFSDGSVAFNGGSSSTTNVVAIARRSGTRVWLKSDGTVESYPYNAPASLSNVIAVAAGANHGLALRNNGTVAAWGDNSYGQTNVPTGLSNVVVIAAGYAHNLALKADGTVVAWGNNSSGQANVPAGLTNVAAVFAGDAFSVAIVGASPPTLLSQPPDETVWAGKTATFTVSAIGTAPLRYQWQFNGEIIDGATNFFYRIDRASAAQSGLYNVIISNARGTVSSREATLWVRPDPYFITQPTNQTVLLGENVTFYAPAAGSLPVSYQWFFEGDPVPGGTNSTLTLTNISMGQTGHYWVTASDGRGIQTSSVITLTPRVIATWGSDWSNVNELPDNLLSVRTIAAGGGNSYVLRPDGTAVFWGEDDYVYPGMHPYGMSNIVAIAPGWEFTLFLLTNGTVVAQGLNNDYGQCNVPAGLSDVVAVSAGVYHSLALRNNGTVVAWGDNSYGAASVPAGLTNVVSISAGGYHSLALRADGIVVAWGYGELGATNIPSGLSNVVAIAGGGHHSLALCGDGTVVAWGYNYYGQTNVPTGLSNVVAIAAGFYHSLALRADGTVVAWGANDNLQSSVPANLRNVVAIAAGHSHSVALRAEGLVDPPVQLSNVFCAGSNFSLYTSTILGKSYYMQYCDSLGSSKWNMLPPVPGDGTPRLLVDPNATAPQRFYRVWQKP
jgi:alpha-tubulin suppressor-like RCC1 family protein